ncbi:hypothetical protein [Dehalococcoides mccartyi]|jgi:hypothetical protein|uniref:Uncharacterized protein n=1 Tax=Dehalococcoides mccartyi TaxID=61435 RepID=A0A142V8J9_9CHLR|nr:hypothetical protein [Dehalococcoides mccartyi]AMU86098.1 hypothetical protein Dm11a5_0268 [Dehalococcoides mccartyi]
MYFALCYYEYMGRKKTVKANSIDPQTLEGLKILARMIVDKYLADKEKARSND